MRRVTCPAAVAGGLLDPDDGVAATVLGPYATATVLVAVIVGNPGAFTFDAASGCGGVGSVGTIGTAAQQWPVSGAVVSVQVEATAPAIGSRPPAPVRAACIAEGTQQVAGWPATTVTCGLYAAIPVSEIVVQAMVRVRWQFVPGRR